MPTSTQRLPPPADPLSTEFSYQLRVPSGNPYDPGRLFDTWHVDMHSVSFSEDPSEDERTLLARAAAVVINPFRFLRARPLHEAADELGGDLYDLAATAFGPDGFLAEDLAEQAEAVEAGVLFLDRVEVVPEHRGHGYGWQLAADLITTLGRGCGAVVTFPAPYDGRADSQEREDACARLSVYWSRIGFFDAGRDNLHLLDRALVNPGLDAMLGEGRHGS